MRRWKFSRRAFANRLRHVRPVGTRLLLPADADRGRRPLKDHKLFGPFRYFRHDLHGRGASADDSHVLVAKADQPTRRVATGV